MVVPARSKTRRCPVNMSMPADMRRDFSHPKTGKVALQTYTLLIAKRAQKLRQFSNTYYSPSVGRPNTLRSSLESIPFPRNFSPWWISYVDINRDGRLSPGKERYDFWKKVSDRYTKLRVLKLLYASGCNAAILRHGIKQLKADLKGLRTLYAQLPSVDPNKRTVSVYGKTFYTWVSCPDTLFKIGEALQSMPYHVLKKYGMFRLTFTPGYVSESANNPNYGYMVFPRTIALGKGRVRPTVLHETGHFVDHQIAVQLGYSSFFLSKTKRFHSEWLRRLKLALPHEKDRRLFIRLRKKKWNRSVELTDEETRKWKSLSGRIKRYFLSVYSATNATERFAEAWACYWSLKRSRVQRYAPDLYALFERIRKGESLKAYKPRYLRVERTYSPIELSISSNSSIMKLRFGSGDHARLTSVGLVFKIYHTGGLLFFKIATGYARKEVTRVRYDGGEDPYARNIVYMSLGSGIHVGHKLNGYFRGGAFDISVGAFAPPLKSYFQAELSFPKFRIRLKRKSPLRLDISVTAGVYVMAGSNKRVMASPYLGGSVGLAF